MKNFKSDRLIDKGIDIVVVICGILIALSIGSYRETQKAERQWTMFAKQFRTDANNSKESYTNIAKFYSEQLDKADGLLKKMQSGQPYAEGLEAFLPTMGHLQADFLKDTMFTALIQTGNEFLIGDTNRLQTLGRMYDFETLAMSNINSLSDHFIPEYQRVLKMYYSKNKDEKKLRENMIFLFHNYTRQMMHNKVTYENQLKRVNDTLEHL